MTDDRRPQGDESPPPRREGDRIEKGGKAWERPVNVQPDKDRDPPPPPPKEEDD